MDQELQQAYMDAITTGEREAVLEMLSKIRANIINSYMTKDKKYAILDILNKLEQAII